MPGPRRIIRVFPRRTEATPDDAMAFVGDPPLWRPATWWVKEVHVSCTFTWDRAEAQRLARAWGTRYRNVRIGGPAFDDAGGEFQRGVYLKPGYVITSRGCPNRCEFCLVPEREGELRTLPIRDGWDVLDNNLLACPPAHIEAVFEMLSRQPERARFTGGLEASRITRRIARRLVEVGFDVAYTAYDLPAQRAAVERAIKRLRDAGGWSLRRAHRKLACYVLCMLEEETPAEIESRLKWIVELGATPFPMFYQAPSLRKDPRIKAMKRALRKWMRPARLYSKPAREQRRLFA